MEEPKELTAKLDYWYFGNVIFGGMIGATIVDPLSGAMWKFDGDNTMEGHIKKIDKQ